MQRINFKYTGQLNGEPVIGEGNLEANPENGEFSGAAHFTEISRLFHPIVAACSVLSVSCSNGAKNRGADNIRALTSGRYQSIRTVSISDQHGDTIGLLRVHGLFDSPSEDDTIDARVTLTGYYSGPEDINDSSFVGYDLPTAPVARASALFGSTTVPILHSKGNLQANHDHLYLFEDDVKGKLVANMMNVKIDNLKWNSVGKTLNVRGVSQIQNMDDVVRSHW